MSVKSSKRGNPPTTAKATVRRRLRISMILGLPLWVAVSFIAAQIIVVAVLWVVEQTGVVINIKSAALNTIVAAAAYGLTLLIVIGVPYLLRKNKNRPSLKQLGLDRLPSWMDIVLAPVAAVVYLILSGVLVAVLTHYLTFIDTTQVQDTGFDSITGRTQYMLAFITLVVIAPLAEETLFRGYLYGKLRSYGPVWLAILITSGLFGLAHGQWNVGIDTFALSLVLCSLREVTGSIWAGVLLHMLKNAVAFYFLFINPLALATLGG